MFVLLFKNILLNVNKKIINHKFVYKDLFNVSKYSTSLNIDKNLLNKYLDNVKHEYERINKNEMNSKKLKHFFPIIQILNERDKILELLKSVKELSKENDEEMRKLAEEEAKMYENKILTIEEQLIESIIPENVNDSCNKIILEINAGVGGQEAMLFVKDLFDMYCGFIEYKGNNCFNKIYVKYDIFH